MSLPFLSSNHIATTHSVNRISSRKPSLPVNCCNYLYPENPVEDNVQPYSALSTNGLHIPHHPAADSASDHTPPISVNRILHSPQIRIPPQRVQSQTLFDRQNSQRVGEMTSSTMRPSTAQGFHMYQKKTLARTTSLSHTETCV